MDQISKILDIITISPEDRTQYDVDTLIQLTKDIQFFKYYIEQNKQEIHKNCCRWMVLEQHQSRNVVFNIGTVGAKFYIILEGEVGVYIRNKKMMPNADQERLMRKKPKNKFQKITQLLKEKNFKLETDSSLIREANTLSNIFEQLFKKQVHNFRQQSLLYNRFNSLDAEFVCVSTLKQGSSFGELALINDRPRLATIVCSSNCKFAVLDKDSFQRILKEQEEIKLVKALTLYSSIPLFETFSTYLLKQVHWHSFRVKYKLNEKVFAHGDETDALYIVYSGEFLVFQKFDQSKKTEQEEEESDNLNAEQFFMSQRVKPKLKQKPLSTMCNYIEGTDIRICLLLPYQLLGEEDIFQGTQRSYNVICTSVEGELIRIKLKDFKQKILNDEGARTYLEKNVPLKRKLMANKIVQKKTTVLNNMQFLTQKKQAESLQTKLQNGQMSEATFLSQQLVIPSSQIMKQNFFQSPQSSATSIHKQNERLQISKAAVIPYDQNKQAQSQHNVQSSQHEDNNELNTITDVSTTQCKNKSISYIINQHPNHLSTSKPDNISNISNSDKTKTSKDNNNNNNNNNTSDKQTSEIALKQQSQVQISKFDNASIPKLDQQMLKIQILKQDNLQLSKEQSTDHNYANQMTNSSHRPLSSAKLKEHNALKEYFFEVGDPLLRVCFQEEFNSGKQNTNQHVIKKQEQINTIFKPSKQNPKNHSYHPSSKIFTQPQKEDYIHVNGNIRQVLKYRNPINNLTDNIQSNEYQERQASLPQKTNRTITFLPTDIDQSSPILTSNKDSQRHKTMQDLGPGELGLQAECTPKGIRQAQMGKMQKMIKSLNKSQKIQTSAIHLSDSQSNIIKYKGIKVNSYSNISHFPQSHSQMNLSSINHRYPSHLDTILNHSTKRNTQNNIISQSIASLQEIGNTSPLRANSSMLQDNSKQHNLTKQYANSSSQQNLFSSYGIETEDITTDRSKNSPLTKLSHPNTAKSVVIRRHTDRIGIKEQIGRQDKQNMNIIENQAQLTNANNLLFTPYSQKNLNAKNCISESTLILKELNLPNNNITTLSNKNNKGRIISENNLQSSLHRKKQNNLFFNASLSPNKSQNKLNNKKIIFSSTHLNFFKSQNNMGSQTEIDNLPNHHNTSNIYQFQDIN